jgi:hypothetical protein
MTANPQRGEVEIELGGRRFVMRPTFQAIAEMEKQTGRGVIELLQSLSDGGLKVSELAAIITAGLKAAGEPARYDKVGALLLEGGLEGIVPPVGEFLIGALTGGRELGGGSGGAGGGGKSEGERGNGTTAETA